MSVSKKREWSTVSDVSGWSGKRDWQLTIGFSRMKWLTTSLMSSRSKVVGAKGRRGEFKREREKRDWRKWMWTSVLRISSTVDTQVSNWKNGKYLEVTLYVNLKGPEDTEIKVALFLPKELRDRKSEQIWKYNLIIAAIRGKVRVL